MENTNQMYFQEVTMTKKNQLLMLLGLMFLSNLAFSRAGFGHGSFHGSFRGARSFGRSSGGYFDLAIFSAVLGYHGLKSWFNGLFSAKSSKPRVRSEDNVDTIVDQLYYQHEINKSSTQLKYLFSQTYIALQYAWMKQDLSLVAQELSDKLIRDLNKPLNSLKKNKLVDYLKDIEFTTIKLLKVNKIRKNSYVIRVRLSGLMIDERVAFKDLASMDNKTLNKKEFSDIMDFSYCPYTGWKAVYLKV
jgi:hypothetical protein